MKIIYATAPLFRDVDLEPGDLMVVFSPKEAELQESFIRGLIPPPVANFLLNLTTPPHYSQYSGVLLCYTL